RSRLGLEKTRPAALRPLAAKQRARVGRRAGVDDRARRKIGERAAAARPARPAARTSRAAPRSTAAAQRRVAATDANQKDQQAPHAAGAQQAPCRRPSHYDLMGAIQSTTTVMSPTAHNDDSLRYLLPHAVPTRSPRYRTPRRAERRGRRARRRAGQAR